MGCHFLLQGIFLTLGLHLPLVSPALAGGFFTTVPLGKPFYMWEDAEVRAHWNRSFDKHLSSLGPASSSFPSWIPSGRTTGAAAGAEGSAYLSPSRVSSELTTGGDCSGGWVDALMAATSFVSWRGRQPYLCLQLPLLFNAYFVDGVFNLKGPFLAHFQLVLFSKHSVLILGYVTLTFSIAI